MTVKLLTLMFYSLSFPHCSANAGEIQDSCGGFERCLSDILDSQRWLNTLSPIQQWFRSRHPVVPWLWIATSCIYVCSSHGLGMGRAQFVAKAEGVPLGTCRANQQCHPPCSAPKLVTNTHIFCCCHYPEGKKREQIYQLVGYFVRFLFSYFGHHVIGIFPCLSRVLIICVIHCSVDFMQRSI